MFFILLGVLCPLRQWAVSVVDFLVALVVDPDDLFRTVLYVVLDQLECSCRVSVPLRLRLSEAYHAEFWGVEVCRQCSPCITEQVLYLFLALGSSALHERQAWRRAIRNEKRGRKLGPRFYFFITTNYRQKFLDHEELPINALVEKRYPLFEWVP